MQLAPTATRLATPVASAPLATAAAAAAPATPADPGEIRWPMVGTIRPGGAGAKPADAVVAQLLLEFPANFGAQALIDVTAGAALATFDKEEDAIWDARQRAEGRASLGVVRAADGRFTVNELTVPDTIRLGDDIDHAKQVTLILGPDPILPRTPKALRRLEDPTPANGALLSVWTRSGNTRWDIDPTSGEFSVGFNHM